MASRSSSRTARSRSRSVDPTNTGRSRSGSTSRVKLAARGGSVVAPSTTLPTPLTVVGLHTPKRPRSRSRGGSALDADVAQDEPAEWDVLTVDVMNKYKMASLITNEIMQELLGLLEAGKNIADLCKYGDNLINQRTSKVFKQKEMEKGIAFPTCMSINNLAGHFAPPDGDKRVFAEGDVVKIDLGVHIDGYIVCSANTAVVSRNKQIPTTGRKADVICAAYKAACAALHLMAPGVKNSTVTDTMEKVAGFYNCKLAQGVLSHQMKRFVIDGEKVIIGQREEGVDVPEFEFSEGDVYCVDVVVSTGDGTLSEFDSKTTIYKRNVHATYSLKQAAARQAFSDIKTRFGVFPFNTNEIESVHHKLGLVECVNRGLLDPFPVLATKSGEYIAQFKFTVMLTNNGTHVLSKMIPPYVHSEFPADSELENTINAGGSSTTKISAKRKKMDLDE